MSENFNVNENITCSTNCNCCGCPNICVFESTSTTYGGLDTNKKKKPMYPGKFMYADNYGNIREVYIKEVIYSFPATVVLWSDGTKTVSKCHGYDEYIPDVGLIVCVMKKLTSPTKIYDLIHAWVPDEIGDKTVTVRNKDVRNKEKHKVK